MTRRDAARLGGRRTLALYGVEHFRRLGRRGFAATLAKVYHGDRNRMLNDLISRGLRASDPCPWNGAWTNHRPLPE